MDQQIRPKLVVASADRALDWYERAFGARTAQRSAEGGHVHFAEFTALGTTLTIKDADLHDPASEGMILDVRTDDVDTLWQRVVDTGAEVVFPLGDQAYGSRAGRVRDPFGVQWILSGPLEAGGAYEPSSLGPRRLR